ncbi:MAG: SLC13 family permease [Polyangiales bacterium]
MSEVEGSTPPRHDRAGIALLLMIGMILLNVFDVIDLLTASLIAGGAMIITRCLTGEQARRAIEFNVLIAVGAAIGFATALEKSGAAEVIANEVVALAQPFGRTGLLIAIYTVTAVLAAVVSTKASAALMFPIGASAALSQGIDLASMSYLIMVGAATAFSTPIGYQTNLMVYGPGGYRYTDFLRLGLPLQILVGIVTVTIIVHAWL